MLEPRQVVWSANSAREYRYAPAVPRRIRHQIPLLLVYAPIGRPTILDLYPGHSFIGYMREQGFDVFLLDWGCPSAQDSPGLAEYVQDHLRSAIRAMQKVAGVEEFSLLAWSIGGVFGAIYAALFPGQGLRNLILVTSPLDFSARSEIPLVDMLDERYFHLEAVLRQRIAVPGELIAWGAMIATPTDAILRPLVQLWAHLGDLSFLHHWQVQSAWAADLVPIPGSLLRDLVTELYRGDRLFRGQLKIRGRRVDLCDICANLLNVIAIDDHICPPCQSARLLEIVSSRDKHELRVPGTHVECMAGFHAPELTWPKICEWLQRRSD